MKQELHEAICGANGCRYHERFTSEAIATQQLFLHLQLYHHASTDPKTPSTDFFGWVKPYPSPPESRNAHWLGDTRSV